MRPFTSTISLDEALAILRDSALPITRTEAVPLDEAAGRVVAAAVRAMADVPPFDRSAMDGYALRAADTAGATPAQPVRLRITSSVFTGDVPASAVQPGTCSAIATGAPVPPGADAVVMVEQTVAEPTGLVGIGAPATVGQHIGPRGGDIRAGTTVLTRGTVLSPARLGALAALGIVEVEVFQRPRVFIASTGNEVVEPGTPLAPGKIYDINRFTLAPLVRDHGGEVVIGCPVADSLEALSEAIDEAARARADVMVLSGGSSVGDRDLIVDAVRERGEVLFHGIAVKPGKPTLLGRVGSRLLLGMPGNPTSCLSNAYILLVPLLRQMARLTAWRPETRTAPLEHPVRNTSGRHMFYAVRLEDGRALPAFKGSGDITSLANADGYIEIPADVTDIPAGTLVTITLF